MSYLEICEKIRENRVQLDADDLQLVILALYRLHNTDVEAGDHDDLVDTHKLIDRLEEIQIRRGE